MPLRLRTNLSASSWASRFVAKEYSDLSRNLLFSETFHRYRPGRSASLATSIVNVGASAINALCADGVSGARAKFDCLNQTGPLPAGARRSSCDHRRSLESRCLNSDRLRSSTRSGLTLCLARGRERHRRSCLPGRPPFDGGPAPPGQNERRLRNERRPLRLAEGTRGARQHSQSTESLDPREPAVEEGSN